MSQEQTPAPLVSVVIASYNAACTLPTALNSVITQSYPNLEVVVVDDGSTDRTADLLAEQFPQVRCIRKSNGGLPSARNWGCRAAKGEFIALMDADDICHADRVSVQVALLRARPDVVLCSSEFSAFNADRPIGHAFAQKYYSQIAETPGGIKSLFDEQEFLDLRDAEIRLLSAEDSIPIYIGNCYERLAQGNFIHPPTVMFRREVLEQSGEFDETIRNMCDWDWLVRVARYGKFGYADYPLLGYRLSPNQLSGPVNGFHAILDIVTVREHIARNNPELRSRMGTALDRAVGQSAIAGADAWSDKNRRISMQLLAKAIKNHGFGFAWCKVFAKLALPGTVLSVVRAVRQKARSVAFVGFDRQHFAHNKSNRFSRARAFRGPKSASLQNKLSGHDQE